MLKESEFIYFLFPIRSWTDHSIRMNERTIGKTRFLIRLIRPIRPTRREKRARRPEPNSITSPSVVRNECLLLRPWVLRDDRKRLFKLHPIEFFSHVSSPIDLDKYWLVTPISLGGWKNVSDLNVWLWFVAGNSTDIVLQSGRCLVGNRGWNNKTVIDGCGVLGTPFRQFVAGPLNDACQKGRWQE